MYGMQTRGANEAGWEPEMLRQRKLVIAEVRHVEKPSKGIMYD